MRVPDAHNVLARDESCMRCGETNLAFPKSRPEPR